MESSKTCLLIDVDRYIHIVLEDNGIGFSQEHVNQIFVIFQRPNDRQKYSATGIGLAMCKKIVENHHGFISAIGEPGKGAKFDIYLPYNWHMKKIILAFLYLAVVFVFAACGNDAIPVEEPVQPAAQQDTSK